MKAVAVAAVVLAYVSALAFASAAEAQPGPAWTAGAQYPLPAGVAAAQSEILYQAGGTATLAYLQTTSTSPLQTVLHVGTIAPGAGYQQQTAVSSTSTSIPVGFALAVAPSGAAVLEWSVLEGSDPASAPLTYLASYRAAGAAAWGAPVTLATDAAQVSGIAPQLAPAISPDGTAAAAVDHVDPTLSPAGYRIDVATHAAGAGAAWGAPAQLAAGSAESAENVTLAYDASDDLTAAYDLRLSGEDAYTVGDQLLPAGSQTWGPFEEIAGSAPSDSAGPPQLAVAPDGSAVLSFAYAPVGSAQSGEAEAVTRSGATGAWSAPAALTPGASASSPVAAGISPADIAYVLLSESTPDGGSCAGVVSGPAAAGFTPPQCLSTTDIGPSLSGGVAFIGSDAYFAWSGPQSASGADVVEGASWPASAAGPGSPTDLTAPASGLTLQRLVSDGDGSVAAFWTGAAGGALDAAAFDAGGPVFIAADVPSRVDVDDDVDFNVTCADLWSGLEGLPTWNFGDGTAPLVGAQVAHAFIHTGTYTVTVTASDRLGNTSSASFPVVVEPAPPPKAKHKHKAKLRRTISFT